MDEMPGMIRPDLQALPQVKDRMTFLSVSYTHLEIDPEQDDPDEAVLRWQAQARRIAEKLGKQMVMEAGNAALKGHRVVVDKGKKTECSTLYTSPKAYNHFRSKLWDIYPKAEP